MLRRGNAMPCAMHEVIVIASVGNHHACHVVHFAPLDTQALTQALAYEGNSTIPRPPHNIENLALVRGYLVVRPGKGHPGIIGIDGTRLRQDAPEVKEDQITTP